MTIKERRHEKAEVLRLLSKALEGKLVPDCMINNIKPVLTVTIPFGPGTLTIIKSKTAIETVIKGIKKYSISNKHPRGTRKKIASMEGDGGVSSRLFKRLNERE